MNIKNISSKSSKLLSYFNGKNETCFEYSAAFKALPNSNVGAVKELLSDMTRRGLLMRLREGIYYIIPYEQNSETFMPDWHLIAEHLVKGEQHYIGYYSALQIHNLITQPSLKEQIVVSKQMRPSVIKIKNISFQFIYHNEKHFFGNKKIWIDNYNKVQCSDLEKTIIDCLFKPEYAGGIVEIAKAIYSSRDKIRFDVLLEYAIKFESQPVIKRLGFLLELLEVRNPIVQSLQKIKRGTVVLLDSELPKKGNLKSRWENLDNIGLDSLKGAISS